MMANAVQLLAAAAGPPAAAASGHAAAGGDAAGGGNAALCRSAYRLAHYCDWVYRSILATFASPEWRTQQAVLKAKTEQVGVQKRGRGQGRVWCVAMYWCKGMCVCVCVCVRARARVRVHVRMPVCLCVCV
jgi:hypothetical protein